MGIEESVTRWLHRWREGDDVAIERVTEEVYQDLRKLAAYYLNSEKPNHTLQPTALVHEAYLHLAAIRDFDWKARGQFIAVMAQMMRRILIDHARRRRAAKREAAEIVTMPMPDMEAPRLDVLMVDQALSRLSATYPRHAEAVELRFFGGLTSPEIAQTLNISLATVERDWRFSKAWLHHEISGAA